MYCRKCIFEGCNIYLNQLNTGFLCKKHIDMNTDKHNESGEHWFSIFIDLIGKNRNIPTIYYFDSATSVQKMEELPSQILQLMEKLQEQSNYKFDIYYNDIKHQRGSTECGIYCLYFLTEMLKGTPFKKLIQRNTKTKFLWRRVKLKREERACAR